MGIYLKVNSRYDGFPGLCCTFGNPGTVESARTKRRRVVVNVAAEERPALAGTGRELAPL